MSVRALGTRLFKHASELVKQTARKRYYNTANISEQINAAQQAAAPLVRSSNAQVVPRTFALRNVGIQIGLHARRILIDNVLNRVTNSLASELRKKAAKRLILLNVIRLIFTLCNKWLIFTLYNKWLILLQLFVSFKVKHFDVCFAITSSNNTQGSSR